MHEFWKVLQNKQSYRKNMQTKICIKIIGGGQYLWKNIFCQRIFFKDQLKA